MPISTSAHYPVGLGLIRSLNPAEHDPFPTLGGRVVDYLGTALL